MARPLRHFYSPHPPSSIYWIIIVTKMLFFNIIQIIGKLNELELNTRRQNYVGATLPPSLYTEMLVVLWPMGYCITFPISGVVRTFELYGGGGCLKQIANCLIRNLEVFNLIYLSSENHSVAGLNLPPPKLSTPLFSITHTLQIYSWVGVQRRRK